MSAFAGSRTSWGSAASAVVVGKGAAVAERRGRVGDPRAARRDRGETGPHPDPGAARAGTQLARVEQLGPSVRAHYEAESRKHGNRHHHVVADDRSRAAADA